jgi:hypothetical protein
MINKPRYRLLLLSIPLLVAAGAACASDPEIVVPINFHGQVHIAFCSDRGSSTPILIDATGQGNSALCQKSLTKFALKRANGESLAAPEMQLVTTGDGIVVGANFSVK